MPRPRALDLHLAMHGFRELPPRGRHRVDTRELQLHLRWLADLSASHRSHEHHLIGEYYAYLPGSASAGTYELVARLESTKYTSAGGAGVSDGGYSSQYYEAGKDLTLALGEPQVIDRVTTTDYLAFDTSGLVGYWPLNEGQGTTALDRSGNGNGGAWYGSTPHYTTGFIGAYAGSFNGSTTYVQMPNSPNLYFLASSSYTWTAWFNVSTFNPLSQSILRKENSGITGVQIVANAGYARMDFYGGSPTSLQYNTTITPGVWYFVAITYNGGSSANNVQIYLNGSLGTTGTETGAPSDTTADSFIISDNYVPDTFNGAIDDVRVYNRILSASEISAMYNGGM